MYSGRSQKCWILKTLFLARVWWSNNNNNNNDDDNDGQNGNETMLYHKQLQDWQIASQNTQSVRDKKRKVYNASVSVSAHRKPRPPSLSLSLFLSSLSSPLVNTRTACHAADHSAVAERVRWLTDPAYPTRARSPSSKSKRTSPCAARTRLVGPRYNDVGCACRHLSGQPLYRWIFRHICLCARNLGTSHHIGNLYRVRSTIWRSYETI